MSHRGERTCSDRTGLTRALRGVVVIVGRGLDENGSIVTIGVGRSLSPVIETPAETGN